MGQNYSVMICDDNMAVHDSITSYLSAEKIEAISVYDGQSALDELSRKHVDVVILDLMLPDMDGLDVCRQIRKQTDVHIIMLSARGDSLDRIVGLEVGADDYLSKPFSPQEVVVRIKKALKRIYSIQEPKSLTLAELTLYPEQYKVYVNQQEVKISAKEFDVLFFMMSNPSKVLTREQILNYAWGYDYYGDTRVVDTLIKRLRQKLPQENIHYRIHSVYGVGYEIYVVS